MEKELEDKLDQINTRIGTVLVLVVLMFLIMIFSV